MPLLVYLGWQKAQIALRCLLSKEILNSSFSAWYIKLPYLFKDSCQLCQLCGFGNVQERQESPLSYLYWTPKLHKTPFKHRFIAGSSKCTTKDSLFLFTKLLSTAKDGLIRYRATKTSFNGVNNMWILKNSTYMLS